MARPEAYVPVAVTRRSGFDESVHFGAVVCLGHDGSVEYAAGDPTVGIYPRSSNKPAQATAMVRRGLRLPPELLALVCASHDGTAMHIAGVRTILAGAGLGEGALGNTPGLPLDPASSREIIRAGGEEAAVTMNCSGKHSGMLATCVVNGWEVAGYLDPAHELQRCITDTIDELAEEEHVHIGIDGCGAPAHALSLLGLARTFRRIACDAGDVYRAMTEHPQMVGGERRDVTTFMRSVPGLVAKDGADGVFAAALPDGRAVALKISDGANLVRPAVMVDALRRLGVDTTDVAAQVIEPVLGHGRRVGEVRSVLP